MTEFVLSTYGLQKDELTVEEFGSGLINSTWKVSAPGKQYILQRINSNVFQEPAAISGNISLIANHLKNNYPDYLFAAPIISNDGNEMIYVEGNGYFRLLPFIEGSHTFDVATTLEMAFEAAIQFGRFTRLLSGIEIDKLEITIPDFHNLSLRYLQFLSAAANTTKLRNQETFELIETLKEFSFIANEYEKILTNPEFKKRVTHHDTKISNVLFNHNRKGLCVIDLDTVMPGYFISDVGDMMRTYISPVGEEESDFSKIIIRKEYYTAIVEGYMSEMKDELTEIEKKHFFYAGKFSIYMQALRFLTDYLNGDEYYGAAYPGQNLVRASNQTILLKRLMELAPDLYHIAIDSR